MTDLLVEHFGDYVDVAFTARMEEELDEIASGERAWVPFLRGFYVPLKKLVDEKGDEIERWVQTDRRGLFGGPPDGHPDRSQRPIPGLLALPGAQGDPAGPGRRAAAPGGDRRGLPRSAARGRSSARTGGSGRSSAARAIRTASTSRRTARRRPIRSRSRSSARRTRTAISSRVARGAPGTSSGGAPTTRAATSPRTTSHSAACTTPTTARWPARTRRRSASSAARPATRRRPTSCPA